MANEMENAIKNAATSVAQYVKNASIMQVETRFVEIGEGNGANFDQTQPVARTVIKLDGDSETVIPLRRSEAGTLEVDASMFELHQQNVTTAIEYRVRILNALLSTFTRNI